MKKATMQRDRQATDSPLARLFSLRWWRRGRVRDDAEQRLCAVAGDGDAQARDAGARADAAGRGIAGGAQALGARPRALRLKRGGLPDTRGRTVMTYATAADIREGDVFTIAGVRKLDARWWPRFRNWLLRRPPPTLPTLQPFKVREVLGGSVGLK